jgi:ABC-type lipoprotein release transport system permease subunit
MSDLRFALRQLLKTPGFTLLAILSLGVGIGLGVVGGVLAGVALAGLLAGVRPLDPLVLLGASVLMGGLVLAACLVPARCATGVNVVDVLRAE